MDPSLHRMRVAYRKRDRLAYLGHLEVLHTIERSIRRSQVPFGVSSGFARRMRLQVSQALPVGAASECEYFDVGLTVRLDPARALDLLVASTPSQLAPYASAYVPAFLPALETWLTRATWHVVLTHSGGSGALLDAAIHTLYQNDTLHFMRGDKPRSIQLSTTLIDWNIRDVRANTIDLMLETRSSNRGALRPAVLLNAAFEYLASSDVTCTSLKVTRVMQRHEASDGILEDPFDVTLSKVVER